jgi:hypothetical protein
MRTTPVRPARLTCPTAWAIRDGELPFGDLEQGSGLLREPLCERNIGFPLPWWPLHPTAEHHAFEREGPGRK